MYSISVNINKSIYILYLLAFLVNSSCGKPDYKFSREYVKKIKIIPEDFGGKNTLICVIRDNNESKWVKKYIEDLYKGEYVFFEMNDPKEDANFEEIESFNNKDKYRFVLDCIVNEDIKYGGFIYLDDRKNGKSRSAIVEAKDVRNIINYMVLDMNEILK